MVGANYTSAVGTDLCKILRGLLEGVMIEAWPVGGI